MSMDFSILRSNGGLFHTRGAVYAKLLSPRVLKWVTFGFRRCDDDDLKDLDGVYTSISLLK